jgi:hypothetical protein
MWNPARKKAAGRFCGLRRSSFDGACDLLLLRKSTGRDWLHFLQLCPESSRCQAE